MLISQRIEFQLTFRALALRQSELHPLGNEISTAILPCFYFELKTTFKCYAEGKILYRLKGLTHQAKILKQNKLPLFGNLLSQVTVVTS